MFGSKKRFSPSLINLGKYKRMLLSSKAKKVKPAPIRPIPNIVSGWTDEEMAAMEENRQQAKAILRDVLGDE